MAPRNEKLNKSQDHNGKLAVKANESFNKSNRGKKIQGKHSTDQVSSLLARDDDSEFRGGVVNVLSRGDGTTGRSPNIANGSTLQMPVGNMDQVDDFYFSALADDDELLPISDEKYADELQLQEVLTSSSIPFINTNIASSSTTTTAIKKEQCSSSSSSTMKVKTEQSFCKICMETSPTSHMFMNKNCSHTFCNDCLRRYISTKIKENISAIKCPEENCKVIIEPENCQGIVPKEVFERWGNALCEAMILGANKFSYCPFKDCSALLLNDGDDDNVTQSECPSCRRLFCAKCEVVWHAGLTCEEVKRLGAKDREAEDFRLIETAKSNKWMKCPQCKFYVEKTQGCIHITCRCRYEFCYRCGKMWNDIHACCNV